MLWSGATGAATIIVGTPASSGSTKELTFSTSSTITNGAALRRLRAAEWSVVETGAQTHALSRTRATAFPVTETEVVTTALGRARRATLAIAQTETSTATKALHHEVTEGITGMVEAAVLVRFAFVVVWLVGGPHI